MIANASPLIVAAKADLLKELIELYKVIEISREVYNEAILGGLKENKQDALLLNSVLKEGKIKVIELGGKYIKIASKIMEECNLDKGEAETIALALQLNRKEILMDEAMGRKVAKLFNLKPKGILRVLLDLYNKKKIDERQLKTKVNEIIGKQFRLDAEIMGRFWELFEKMGAKKL